MSAAHGDRRHVPPSRRPSSPDAVVIGSGHNGLVAANLLLDAGWSVVVCEAATVHGGAVRSAEVTQTGFISDLYSAFYPLAAASPVLAGLDLQGYGLRWTHAPAVLCHVMPDDRAALLSRDVSVTAASLDSFSSGDGEAWIRLTEQWARIGPAVIDALLQPFPPARPVFSLLRQLGGADALRMVRMALLPVRRFGEENFRGAGGPILLAGNALHADLPPDGAGSALYGWLLAMLGSSHGFPVPIGGAGVLADALVRRLQAGGGELRLDAPVVDVDVRHGTATGVRLASGEFLPARRAVLADVAAPHLFNDLVGPGHLPARFIDDLTRFQWDTPTLKLDWALDRRVPWTSAEASQAGTVHLGVDMDGLTDYAGDLATHRIPHQPFVLFGQMTTADGTRSPVGTESAWAYTHLPRGRPLDDADLARHVHRVETLLERHAPGFQATILARHIQSPHDMQAHDANLYHGAINGGTAQLHQQAIFRPVPGLGGATTPIDRLFLAGSSAHPGGGVHGAPGSNAALAALSRHRFGGRLRRHAIDAILRQVYR